MEFIVEDVTETVVSSDDKAHSASYHWAGMHVSSPPASASSGRKRDVGNASFSRDTEALMFVGVFVVLRLALGTGILMSSRIDQMRQAVRAPHPISQSIRRRYA